MSITANSIHANDRLGMAHAYNSPDEPNLNWRNIMRMRTIKIAASVIGSLLAFAVLPAGAAVIDTFSFDLTTGNTGLAGYSGDYAKVTVDLNSSTTATITFTSLTAGGNIYLLGDGGSVAVNVNATHWTLGTISGSNAGTGFDPGNPYDNGKAGNEDGFGKFNQTINSFDGFQHSSDTISFTLTGGTWASAAAVLTANGNNALAAAHIFVASLPANANNGALTTGYAAGNNGGGSIQVPDGGSTVTLLGLAMLGLGALRRTFSRN